MGKYCLSCEVQYGFRFQSSRVFVLVLLESPVWCTGLWKDLRLPACLRNEAERWRLIRFDSICCWVAAYETKRNEEDWFDSIQFDSLLSWRWVVEEEEEDGIHNHHVTLYSSSIPTKKEMGKLKLVALCYALHAKKMRQRTTTSCSSRFILWLGW